jgi:hypothetical protein
MGGYMLRVFAYLSIFLCTNISISLYVYKLGVTCFNLTLTILCSRDVKPNET